MSFSRAGPSSAGEPGVVLHREAVADRARDREAEARRRRADAQVAGGGEREAGAHREAVDERDGRLAHGLEPPDDAVDRRLVGERVGAGLVEVGELADVGAGHERLLARAAEDEHADVVVGVGGLAGGEELLVHRERHRVVRLGPVERDPQGRPAALGEDLAHGRPRCPPRAGSRRCAGRAAAPAAAPRPACRDSFTGMPSARIVPSTGCSTVDLHLARLRVLVGEHLRRSRGSARTGRRPRPARRPTRRWSAPRAPLRAASTSVGDVGHPVVVGGEARVVGELGTRRAWRRGAPNSACVLPPTVM